jgi:hypothetical protein
MIRPRPPTFSPHTTRFPWIERPTGAGEARLAAGELEVQKQRILGGS